MRYVVAEELHKWNELIRLQPRVADHNCCHHLCVLVHVYVPVCERELLTPHSALYIVTHVSDYILNIRFDIICKRDERLSGAIHTPIADGDSNEPACRITSVQCEYQNRTLTIHIRLLFLLGNIIDVDFTQTEEHCVLSIATKTFGAMYKMCVCFSGFHQNISFLLFNHNIIIIRTTEFCIFICLWLNQNLFVNSERIHDMILKKLLRRHLWLCYALCTRIMH